MTAEEMELLKKAGTATIYPGGVIDISQEKVTRVKINGVEVTSASNPVNLNSIRADDVQKIAIDNDGSVNLTSKNLSYKDKAATVKTQSLTYYGNAINFKRPVDTAKIRIGSYRSNPLFVIDGVTTTDDAFNTLNLNEIESVAVLKDGAASIYGKGSENGVIVVNTKKDKNAPKTVMGGGIRVVDRYGYNNFNSPTNTTTTNIFTGKLLIVDGKEMSQSAFSKIPADKIDVIKKGGAKELKKYGDKAKNGVLIITTTR